LYPSRRGVPAFFLAPRVLALAARADPLRVDIDIRRVGQIVPAQTARLLRAARSFAQAAPAGFADFGLTHGWSPSSVSSPGSSCGPDGRPRLTKIKNAHSTGQNRKASP